MSIIEILEEADIVALREGLVTCKFYYEIVGFKEQFIAVLHISVTLDEKCDFEQISYYVCSRRKSSLVGTGGPAPCHWALPDQRLGVKRIGVIIDLLNL